jgi:hypothetical protein
MSDNDDRLAPLETHGVATDGSDTRFVGQILQPYMKNWLLLRCPLDASSTDAILQDGATTQAKKEYNMAIRAHRGYNSIYLNRYGNEPAGLADTQKYDTVRGTALSRPAQTLMFVDSVWDKSGVRSPYGGGNWQVIAPSGDNSNEPYLYYGDWNVDPKAWNHWGGAYDYVEGTITISYLDGHARSQPTPTLWAGMTPDMVTKRPSDPWGAHVSDWDKYVWGGHPN